MLSQVPIQWPKKDVRKGGAMSKPFFLRNEIVIIKGYAETKLDQPKNQNQINKIHNDEGLRLCCGPQLNGTRIPF